MPTCSVVVCTRDRPAELEKCLAGIRAQTLQPMEVVVVDNSSIQAAADICSRFGVRCVQEAMTGASWARNRGASESRGDVIAYLDDDAFPAPDWLANLVGSFDDENIMAVGGRTVAPECDLAARQLCALIQGPGAAMEPVVLDNTHPQWFEITAFGGLGMTGNMAFRRKGLEHVSGFDTRLGLPDAAGEEQFAVFNLVDQGFKAAYAPRAVVTHPTTFTVDGLRRRYFAACSYAISYVLFFLVHVPKHRKKLLKFLFEAIRGVKREWRGNTLNGHGPGVKLSRVHVMSARLRGVWLYMKSGPRRRNAGAVTQPALGHRQRSSAVPYARR